MVAKPETLGRFIFNSDYPVDKVVWLYEGQFTTSSSSTLTAIVIDMEEQLGSRRPIFVKGAVSIDDWQTAIMIGAQRSTLGNASMSMAWTNYNMDLGRSGAFLELTPDFRSYPNRTAKYRLWGVVREDMRDAAEYSKNSTTTKSKLNFNTDNNYPRLYMDGIAKSGTTIEHNLGKIPYVDFWYNIASTFNPDKDYLTSYWSYNPSGSLLNSGLDAVPTIKATDKTLTFTQIAIGGGGTIRDVWFYYRVYA